MIIIQLWGNYHAFGGCCKGLWKLKETAQEPNEVHSEVVKDPGGVRKAFA
jgi:hypothetical protein